MKRMKTFFIYALLVAVVLISTDVIVNICLKTGYRKIKNYKIETDTPSIIVKEAKTTNANGYIEGTVTNNSGTDIENAYVKVDLISKRGNNVGTEYFEIQNLKQNESKEFKINYQQENVDSFTINTVDGVVKKNIELMPFLENAEIYFAAGLLISIAPFYFF